MRKFEIICTADAQITERWHVTAIDEEHAEERLLGDDSRGGDVEFIEQVDVDHEENRDVRSITELSDPPVVGVYKITLLWAERPDPGDEAKTYRFATKGEYDAFMLGVSEANGWINVREAPEGYVVPDPDDQTDEDEEILSAQMF